MNKYTILDKEYNDLSDIEKLAIGKVRKWMPWSCGWYPSKAPTEKSIRLIKRRLGIQIPDIYIQLASVSPNYGVWFGSIGPDVESYNNIIKLNKSFHDQNTESNPLPENYILMNHGHDDHCDCWNLHEVINGEHPIYYINVGRDIQPKLLATSFIDYWCNHT